MIMIDSCGTVHFLKLARTSSEFYALNRKLNQNRSFRHHKRQVHMTVSHVEPSVKRSDNCLNLSSFVIELDELC